MRAREDPVQARIFQPEHVLEQPGEHCAIIRQDRIVAVLEQMQLVDLHLLTDDPPAIDTAIIALTGFRKNGGYRRAMVPVATLTESHE